MNTFSPKYVDQLSKENSPDNIHPHKDYIKQLVDVFKQAEDLESLDNLHALCSCMQTIREFLSRLATRMLTVSSDAERS